MKELLYNTRQLDQMIDELLPLLITDEWQKAYEKLMELIPFLNDFLQNALQEGIENASLEFIKSVLERLIYCIEIGDSIQLADILAYEVGELIQNVYKMNCIE